MAIKNKNNSNCEKDEKKGHFQDCVDAFQFPSLHPQSPLHSASMV